MRRFFIDKSSIKDNIVTIIGKEAHHIKDVIRLKIGDRFMAIDGGGKTYTLKIDKLKEAVIAKIEKVASKQVASTRILLASALPKKSKIDYIIEKATELGVTDIVPMLTERVIVKVDNKSKSSKQIRWKNIIIESTKQCGRDTLPTLHKLTDLKGAIAIAQELGYDSKLIPYVSESVKQIKQVIEKSKKDVAIFIGPEGDFTDKEIALAEANNLIPVSLGELVLRVDTACIYAVSAAKILIT